MCVCVCVCVCVLFKPRKLFMEEKIIIYKTLTIVQLAFKPLIVTFPNHIIKQLQKIEKEFLWGTRNLKIKHETQSKDYQQDRWLPTMVTSNANG